MATYSKTLGSENAHLFTTLAGKGQIVFSIDEAQDITGKSYAATQQALLRLTRAGWLVKLGLVNMLLSLPLLEMMYFQKPIDW